MIARALLIFVTLLFSSQVALAQFSQQGPKLVGDDAVGPNTAQGWSVAISADGNTAIVGGYGDNRNIGAAWIYTRSGGVWTQQGNKLVGTGAVGKSLQGYSVALSADGNTAVVGGPGDNPGSSSKSVGAAWVFTRSDGDWIQQGSKLVGTTSVGAADDGAGQGASVALSGDGNTLIVGGPGDNGGAGATWVFTRRDGVWTQQGSKLVGAGAVGSGNVYSVAQGHSVALSADGNTAIVGGPGDNPGSTGNGVGAAWVFTRSDGVWTQQGSKLTGNDAINGATGAQQGFAVALSADGNTAMVGGDGDNAGTGAAWVFTRSDGVWTQQGSKLTGNDAIGPAQQGSSVALSASGKTAFVGGWKDAWVRNVPGTGAVWVYTRTGNAWTQQDSKLVGTGAVNGTLGARLGYFVALSADGSTAIMGGYGDNQSVGAAWVFSSLPIFQVAPSLSVVSAGVTGGPFTPSSFQYQLSASVGSVGFSISGIPTWLNASFTSGTLTSQPLTVTFTLTASAKNFAVGTYTANITFTNATNGRGNTFRTATLTVNAPSQSQATPTATLTTNPSLPSETLAAAASPITIGETAITPNNDSGNANFLIAQQASLSQTATIQSMSFYVTAAAGKLRLGIYDATGPGGGPGTKIAETAEITPVVGWNTANVTSQVSLPAGTYWLAYLPSSNSLKFRNAQTGSAKYYSLTYGALPSAYSTNPNSGTFHFSFYATLIPGSANTPTVGAVNPNTGPSAGGTSVSITGTNFTGATAVNFGGSAASGVTVVSATSITATSPAHAVGAVDVTVTTPNGTSATGASDMFTYTAAPTVSAVNPNTGPSAGGTSVSITGTNFTGATAVNFGGSAASGVTVVSATSITATSPAHAVGAVDVTVTTPNGTSATGASDRFTYTAAPTVSAVNPNTGPSAGGTSVSITGTNFTGATAVNFGGSAASGVTVVSATSITATSPAHAVGAVDVTVTTPNGTSATGASDRFTYTAAPTVSAVNPNTGPSAGGTSVSITGTNFTGATAVNFGGSAASGVTVVSATSITATSPAHAVGAVDVTVTTPNGTSATGASDRFTYTAAPTVSAVNPNTGPSAGGTSVSITGTNFTGATAVNFGGSAASGVTVVSATSITATSPAHAVGAVDVTVTTPNGTSATGASDRFTYTAAPTVSAVNPNTGPSAGGTSVSITGTNFTGATAVNFGGSAASGVTVVSATSITATSPAHAVGAVDVTVTTPNGTSATGASDRFTYTAAPTVSAVNPNTGPSAGGTSVSITGTNFTGATAVNFGGSAASGVTVVSATSITATSPAHAVGAVDVTVTTPNGTSATGASDRFTYTAASPITIGETAITPNNDSGNANFLIAQQASLSQTATIQSMSFYVTAAAGKLRLGIYDATGPGGGPGTKIAETAEITPVVGWNTANVTSQVSLPAGTYWLAYLPSSNSLKFRNAQTGSAKYYSLTYGALPSAYSTNPNSGTFHFSFYATLIPGSANTPTVGAVNPNTGPSAGGTSVSITGTNFTGATAVNFGGSAASGVTVVSATSITATSPAHAVGAVDVTVTTPNGTSATSASDMFTYTVADTVPPTVPTNLTATAISSTQINLAWTASTDNVGVTGYQILRNGVQVGTSATNSYSDSGLTASTTYTYTVSAYDAAGNISAQSSAANATTPAPSSGTPTLIQHVASSANPVGVGISGNNFKIPLPNSVGSGNAIILGMTYPSGSSPTITDNNGNTWPTTAAVSANAGPGGNISSIWVLPNANAGQTTITVSFASAIIPFNYVVSEFNNVATANPLNGTSATANDAGASIATGSFTPGNNDGNGGNLIWNYYAVSGGANGNPTSWVSGSGFTLLDADIAWNTKQGFPHATQYLVQTAAAPINPGITATADTDSFNGVAVALKAASAGTATSAGIHINKIIHQTTNVPPSTWTLQEPATGNLRVLATANSSGLTNITSVTDSDGGVWTKIEPAGDEPQIWYSKNTSPNPNLSVTIHGASGPTITVLFYDIAGAAADPFDVAAGAPSTDVSNQTMVNNMPSITPTTANGLVIAVMGLGQGPGLGLNTGAPTGAVFDLVTYTGELDLDLMENADGQAHFYNASTVAENWNWLITANPNNSAFATAVAFKSALTTPTVTSVSPSSGPSAGGTSVGITGSNFTGATAVHFGSSAASGVIVNSATSITATAPAHAAGAVDVTVTTPSGTSTTSSADLFTYQGAPTVTGLSPGSGPLAGGTSVGITGSNFTGATAVHFGSSAASGVIVNSATSITATAPAHAAGAVDVTVTTPSGTSTTSSADLFTYQGAPTVTGLSPGSGPLAGGTSVGITGSNFTGATAVHFGSSAASGVIVNSATSITATAPAHAAGAVDVTVTTPSGTSTTSSADLFTYQGAPTVTGLSPGSGPLAGGTSVGITGSNFTGATAVHFGSSAASGVIVNSATSITATAPAHAAGAVDVTVTTPSGTSTTSSADLFTYIVVPTFVSAMSGSDIGLCPITAPCATLNYALSVTEAGGQVTILDGGVFGPVVLTQEISIVGIDPKVVFEIDANPAALVGCVGGAAGTCSVNNGYGVEIAAGVNDTVTLKNLQIGAGTNGAGALKFTSGGKLQLSENVYRGNDTATGPIVALYPNNLGSTQAQVYFSRSDVGFNSNGGAVEVKPSGNTSLMLQFSKVEVHNANFGIRTDSSLQSGSSINVETAISESEFFSFANAAVNAFSTAGAGTTNAVFDAVRILNANVAIKANGPQSTVIFTNSTISGNGTGVQAINGGKVFSSVNNTISGNGVDVSGTLTAQPLQ